MAKKTTPEIETEIEIFDLSKRVFSLVIVFVVGLFAFWGFRMYEIWQNVEGHYPHELTVEGTGSAFVVPDVAKIILGVTTEGETSEAVVSENAEKMEAVMIALDELEIEKAKIKTTGYYLNPRYKWTEENGSYQDGYELRQTLEVKLEDFEKVNQVISQTTSVGANMVGSVSFEVDDVESVKSEAREEAIAVAKEKAEQISEASGLKLGKLVNYYEYSSSYYDYGKGGYAMAESRAYAADEYSDSLTVSSVDIEPGEEEVTLTVTLTYRIK
jgi:uncharacterized protein